MKRGCECDVTSAAYTSELPNLTAEAAPELWIYGHTHESRDFEVRSMRIGEQRERLRPVAADLAHLGQPEI